MWGSIMTMNLKQWSQFFLDDLSKLESKAGIGNSTVWASARIMATESARLESNLLSGMSIKNNIENAAKQLGQSCKDVITDSLYYLPDADDHHGLLFSIIYLQNLIRFKDIESSSSIINSNLKPQIPFIERQIIELNKRIDAFCNNPMNKTKVHTALPELAVQQGDTLVAQVKNWLAEKSIEEKLIERMESDTQDIIEEYTIKQNSLEKLFADLDAALKTNEDLLRELACYKKLIESLKDGSLLPENLNDSIQIETKFPEYAGTWIKFHSSIADYRLITRSAVKTTRAMIAIGRASFKMLGVASQWTLGWITPTFISERASKLVSTISNLTEAITPDTIDKKRQERYLTAAELKINSIAQLLNGNKENSRISGSDFSAISSKEINNLADKVAIIRHMVHIQKCLEQYRAEHSTGIVKFSLSNALQSITVLLSKSFLRPLIHDKILLSLEAKSLDMKLKQLIEGAEQAVTINQTDIASNLTNLLSDTKKKSELIHQKSLYAFFSSDFKTESIQASNQLKNVLASASSTLNNKGVA